MANQSANIINSSEFFYKVEELCQNSSETNLYTRLRRVFKEYNDLIRDCQLQYPNLSPITFPLEINIRQETIILKAVMDYESGKVEQSYEELKGLWDIQEVWDALKIKEPQKRTFYRARESSKPIGTKEAMFHVPFELRYRVATARFSMPGYPCLYLTKHIYTAWEEYGRAPIERMYYSRVFAPKALKLIDLRLRRTFSNGKEAKTEISSYLHVIPLIIACSLRVSQPDAQYKYEYIIPQMLLHILIEEISKHANDGQNKNNNLAESESSKAVSCFAKDGFDGIMYSSTKADPLYWKPTSVNTDCIVIPVRKISNIGYCEQLAAGFQLTKPLAFDYKWLKKMSRGTTKNETYSQSYFHLIEDELHNINLEKI